MAEEFAAEVPDNGREPDVGFTAGAIAAVERQMHAFGRHRDEILLCEAKVILVSRGLPPDVDHPFDIPANDSVCSGAWAVMDSLREIGRLKTCLVGGDDVDPVWAVQEARKETIRLVFGVMMMRAQPQTAGHRADSPKKKNVCQPRTAETRDLLAFASRKKSGRKNKLASIAREFLEEKGKKPEKLHVAKLARYLSRYRTLWDRSDTVA